jgi:hypothetical protein
MTDNAKETGTAAEKVSDEKKSTTMNLKVHSIEQLVENFSTEEKPMFYPIGFK